MNKIKHGQFLTNLHACSEDMEYVASKIKDIIIAEIKQKGMCVEIIPDVQRLVRMGFKSDAITVVSLISDYSISNMSLTRLVFHCLGLGELHKHDKRLSIYVESCTTEFDITTVVYCNRLVLKCEDESKWKTALLHTNQIKMFYENYRYLGIFDSSDHNGNHLQDVQSPSFDNIDEFDYQELVKDYIESGYEVVTL